MSKPLSTRALPAKADLKQLKRQAKELLRAYRASGAGAAAEVDAHYRGAGPAAFALDDAQLVLARSYGFDSWPKLKAYVAGATIERLAAAVRRDDAQSVDAMLRSRPELVNMSLSESDEHRPLHFAVLGRLPRMARLLMRRGADAHEGIYPHRSATTAMTLARERGYDEIAAIIREEERRRGETRSADGPATAARDRLTRAVIDGDAGAVGAMLDGDPALLEAPNRRGWPPLHVAAAMGNAAIVHELLGRKADPNRPGPDGRFPLDCAVGRGWENAVEAEKFAAAAALLRAAGAELTARAAVALGDAERLCGLHAAGSLVNPVEHWGGLLTIAVRHDRIDMLELLLDLGLDPDERMAFEELEGSVQSWGTPLRSAAVAGKFAAAKLLLARGADPNGKIYASGTPVFAAYGRRDREMVRLLQSYGGLVDAVTLAHYRETEQVGRILAAADAGALPEGTATKAELVEDILWSAACGGDPDIVRMALQRTDWTRGDPRWRRILAQPTRFWNHMRGSWAHSDLDRGTYLRCFQLVLERCDVNVPGRFGNSILHQIAASRDHLTAGERIAFANAALDAGAKLDCRDDLLQSTPLGWACRWGRVELVELLLSRGAEAVEEDAEPWATPQAWAQKMGRDDVTAILRRHNEARRKPEERRSR